MFTKIMSFAMAIASRGINNNKIDLETKKLRYISCYGIDEIPNCPNLKKSNSSDFYYCGGCGCGDHPHTWLQKNNNEYSKLDYPHLTCPLKMPGFNNYDPSSPKESLERKKLIENLDPNKLNFVQLTLSVDEEKQKIFDKVAKIIKNS
jgi:hypothetical protein